MLIGEIDPEVAQRLTTENVGEVLRDVVTYDETIETEDGSFEQRSVVRFPERAL